jgi:hypothetical protein
MEAMPTPKPRLQSSWLSICGPQESKVIGSFFLIISLLHLTPDSREALLQVSPIAQLSYISIGFTYWQFLSVYFYNWCK